MRLKIIVFVWMLVHIVQASIDPFTVQFIEQQEGFKSHPYSDNTQYSIGFGTDVIWAKEHGLKRNYINRSDAEKLLIKRLEEDHQKLVRLIPTFDSLPVVVQSALYSAYYNCPSLIGPRLRKFVVQKDWNSAGLELALNHANLDNDGLRKRRIMEGNLILSMCDMKLPPNLSYDKAVYARKVFLSFNR